MSKCDLAECPHEEAYLYEFGDKWIIGCEKCGKIKGGTNNE